MLAFELAKIYLRFYKQAKGRNLYSLKKVKDSKWWMYFYKTVTLFSSKEEWDAFKFVEAQFSDGVVFPPQLATDKAWENFLEYQKRLKEDIDAYVANSCATVFKYIRQWSNLKGDSRPIFRDFLQSNRENILRGAFTLHFFSILRPFYDFYAGLDESQKKRISVEDLEKKRVVIHSIPRLKKKLKEVLGDDFV
jgi:hypothetical protein